MRVLQQRPANGNHVELIVVHAAEQLIQRRRIGSATHTFRAVQEVPIQAHAPHGNGGLAGNLFGPASQVQVGAFELRQPEATGGGMENINTGLHQRGQKTLQLFRVPRQFGVVILLLPL